MGQAVDPLLQRAKLWFKAREAVIELMEKRGNLAAIIAGMPRSTPLTTLYVAPESRALRKLEHDLRRRVYELRREALAIARQPARSPEAALAQMEIAIHIKSGAKSA